MLRHLRVLDLTSELGAFAGRMLAELGAEVIKVEAPDGDPQRRDTATFATWNHGKRSVVAEPGTAAFEQLLTGADILLRNPGLDHKQLAAHNPRLIDVVIAPFLPGSPNDARQVSDLSLMARSGLMSVCGDPDRPPLTMPGAQAYALAAIQAVTGALTALHARATTGRGQLVEVSALQAAVLANYRDPLTWEWTGRIGRRTGNLLIRGKSGVRQIWPCADGFVTWALVDNPSMMRSMARVMGEQAGPLASIAWDDILVADLPRETLAEWEEQIAAFFLQHTRAQLRELSLANGLGLSWIDAPEDVLQSPQWQARKLWVDIDDRRLPGPLWVSTVQPASVRRMVPALGEANAELLGGGQ